MSKAHVSVHITFDADVAAASLGLPASAAVLVDEDFYLGDTNAELLLWGISDELQSMAARVADKAEAAR